jgi:hypothetical protein
MIKITKILLFIDQCAVHLKNTIFLSNLKVLACVWEVLSSNLGRDTDNPEFFFLPLPSSKYWNSITINSQTLPSASFPIRYS